MKRILILEPDEDQSRRLSEAIMPNILGDAAISVATSVREACLLVARQPHDLAFLRIEELLPARRALHSLQPELAIAAVAPDEAHGFAGIDTQNLRGVVARTNLNEGVRRVLGAGAKPDPATFDTVVATTPTGAEESRLRDLLDGAAANEKILGSILTTANSLLAKSAGLSDSQAQAIMQRVIATWHEGDTALLQFIRPPDRTVDLLIYSRPALPSQLLTLAASSDANLSRLRRVAQELAARIAGHSGEAMTAPVQAPPITTRSALPGAAASEPAVSVSFALVWRPRRVLPEALQGAVGDALQQVAVANNCTLRHREVTSAFVHIVVTCPDQRSSAWVAQLFKQGVQARIQMQFGVPAKLWSSGFYAKEGETPLSPVELELFARAASED